MGFLLLIISLLCSKDMRASNVQTMRNVEISLLTCYPHEEIYALYGHTAIRYKNSEEGIDLAINYGLFSFQKPFFILRFIFGLTDYEMGIEPFSSFLEQYDRYGCAVKEQTLNLSDEDKARITEAIEKNYQIENRTYRYNYFYDNCTTRARDIIVDNIKGKVEYNFNNQSKLSFRQMIHQYNNNHKWARFGNDLLLGVEADQNTSMQERQFLPENLMNDFARATVNGKKLVSATTTIVNQTRSETTDYAVTPTVCFLLLFFVSLLVVFSEWKTKKIFWGYDLLIMAATGLSGVILFMMLFSQHPTVRCNLQILLLNPLPLIFFFITRKNRCKKWWTIWLILIICFFIGGIWQSYAEGMYLAGLSVLTRPLAHLLLANRKGYKHE